jgi:multiple sugar transport system permease protein
VTSAASAARTLDRVASPARMRWRRRLTVLGFMAPAIAGFALFFIYPLIATVYFSFHRYDLLSPPEFIGFRNYDYFLHSDPRVWQSVRNTLWLVAIMVPARIVFALGVSQVLLAIKRGVSFFRALFYLPALAPPVAATLMFVFLFNPATGPVNETLKFFGIDGPLWFDDPHWSKPGLVLLALWGVGDVMIIILAALLNVPKEQYDAASMDGANAMQRWRYVTLPTISPVLMFAAVTGVIATLQYFTQPAVAAQAASGQATVGGGVGGLLGYPLGSTLTFPQWLYIEGFTKYYLGYASVLALVLFAVALVFVLALIRQFKDTFRAGS